MGLDLTIYHARRPEPGALVALPVDNPHMPEPPEGMRWYEVFYWRKAYALAEALFPGAGSPDWTPLTLARVRVALATPEQGDPPGYRHRGRSVLRDIERAMLAGDNGYLVEVMT